MKATISEAGYLSVSPETELESYALRKWVDENVFFYEKIKLEISLGIVPKVSCDWNRLIPNDPAKTMLVIERQGRRVTLWGVDEQDCERQRHEKYPDWTRV